ncbi:MAG: thymidine phosphorylase [Deltaproteobacteria bacterium]|nr:thymidine phosphorylase [Deltaproteobacteria bacterium]
MRAYDLILEKREGEELSDDELKWLVDAYTRGEIPDYQMASLLMAIFFRGMSGRELATWTSAMLHSGEVVDLSEVPGRKVDKHSTGGVGDKVSLCLAPIVAACGVPVPMVSGRGLGHTGGTLDKLEAIPGFRVDLGIERYKEIVAEHGLCLIGQTETLAPADRKLYALRDVTATVESIPLISSSILSKKLAEGIDALVLDVKVGKGAFMKTRERAEELARTMVELGTRMGKQVVALLTAMDEPLGLAVGNALETQEAIDLLHGRGPADLDEINFALAAQMLVLGEVADDLEAGEAKARAAVADGSALECFRRLVEAQGGDPRVADDPGVLPSAQFGEPVTATRTGVVQGIDALKVGVAAMKIGAGRATKESVIDPAVGVMLRKKTGDTVKAGEVLAVIHVNDESKIDQCAAEVQEAYLLGDEPPPRTPRILDRIVAERA